jgi:hypothetical protein
MDSRKKTVWLLEMMEVKRSVNMIAVRMFLPRNKETYHSPTEGAVFMPL